MCHVKRLKLIAREMLNEIECVNKSHKFSLSSPSTVTVVNS